jgi:hypothetical protein
MKAARLLPAALLTLTLSAGTGSAADLKPTVVELFTSQSCYSCPPAEELLTELATEKSLVALEFHVDYWDDLVYGAAGKWKDVFSKRAYTERQSVYNRNIRGRPNVYTPQIVVDGQLQAVGSRRLEVLSRIREAEKDRRARLDVSVTVDPAARATVRVAGPVDRKAAVWMVRYIRERRTEVRAGENKGKSLLSRNVVTEVMRVGDWKGSETSISVSDFRLADGEGCAVLVQDETLGPILGAATCMTSTS